MSSRSEHHPAEREGLLPVAPQVRHVSQQYTSQSQRRRSLKSLVPLVVAVLVVIALISSINSISFSYHYGHGSHGNHTHKPNPMAANLDKVVLFGDSITEMSTDQNLGFAMMPAIMFRYFRRLDFVNRGFGGYNSRHATYMVDPILDAETAGDKTIRLVVIFFGTNDCAPNEHQNIPISEYKKNLRTVAQNALNRNIKVIVVGPALLNERVVERERTTTDFLSYSNAAHEVAKDLNVGFIDLWHAFAHSVGWKEGDEYPGQRNLPTSKSAEIKHLLTDGIHFSGAGYRVWYDELVKTIDSYAPELQPNRLKFFYPPLDQVDNGDLEGSLRPFPPA